MVMREARMSVNKWLWKNLGFKRKQYPIKVESFKKSKKGVYQFWAGFACGYTPYIIHEMRWLS